MRVAAILAEGLCFQLGDGRIAAPPHPSVPVAPSGQLGVPDPQPQLPLDPPGDQYELWSVDGFPAIVNGYGGFRTQSFLRLKDQVTTFSDARSVDSLRSMGVRAVILHPDLP
jgi:hypothetical protein